MESSVQCQRADQSMFRNILSMSIILVRKRYTGRAARFDWACKNADSVLFVRTGVASREEVCDLLS